MAEMSIGGLIHELALRDPDRPSVTEIVKDRGGRSERTITRRELDLRTNRLARACQEAGAGHDDFVTVALPNGIEFVESCVAIWKLGATPQPVSWRLPFIEREAIVELADSSLVVGVEPGAHGSRACVPEGFEPNPSLSEDPLPDVIATYWKAPTSGGSTGRPKLIVAGQRGVADPDQPFAFNMPLNGVELIPGPLYHNGPFVNAMRGLYSGNQLVIMNRFDPSLALELIEKYRVNWVQVVPTMMHRIWRLSESERTSRDLSSLATVLTLGAPCPAWLKEAWIHWLGPERILELYAGTEAQLVVTIRGDDWLQHMGSVGKPADGRLKILSPGGEELPPGGVGEIFMKPPADRKTYHYIGAEPRLHEEYESLGDMGWLDEDGYLYIADRRTDLILAGGANIYPAEIEAALDEHPLIRSCAVIGLPDDDLGQRVHAIIQVAGEVSDDEVRSFLSERLVRYKIPRSFERTTEPLRDDAGKVRRSALVAERMTPATGAE